MINLLCLFDGPHTKENIERRFSCHENFFKLKILRKIYSEINKAIQN